MSNTMTIDISDAASTNDASRRMRGALDAQIDRDLRTSHAPTASARTPLDSAFPTPNWAIQSDPMERVLAPVKRRARVQKTPRRTGRRVFMCVSTLLLLGAVAGSGLVVYRNLPTLPVRLAAPSTLASRPGAVPARSAPAARPAALAVRVTPMPTAIRTSTDVASPPTGCSKAVFALGLCEPQATGASIAQGAAK